MSWQLMTRGSAQAGNRAGKTARYLQWQENRPEWLAVTSAVDNWHNSTWFLIFPSDRCFGAGPVVWIPFGDHPLKLERYRED